MSRSLILTDSSIVMAEQSSRDVVDQTLSAGEPSLSDVPASTNDKYHAEGDVGEARHIATTSTTQQSTDPPANETGDSGFQAEKTAGDKDAGAPSLVCSIVGKQMSGWLNFVQGSPKQSTGLVASRALELNGIASVSDGGDDTASQGGSESDASRTDGRHHTRTGSVKKPATFKPVSFAKFAVPKAPGAAAPPKAPEKGISMCTARDVSNLTSSNSTIDIDYSSWYTAAELPTSFSCENHGRYARLALEGRRGRRKTWRNRTRPEPGLE